MALELDPLGEELLRARRASFRDRGRDEPERDHRRARAEPALARDRVRERELLPSGGAMRANARTPRWFEVDLAVPFASPRARSRGRARRPRSRSPGRGSRCSRARARERGRSPRRLGDRVRIGVDDDRRRARVGDRRGVLEPVTGQHADDAAPGLDLDVRERREARGRCRLAEEPSRARARATRRGSPRRRASPRRRPTRERPRRRLGMDGLARSGSPTRASSRAAAPRRRRSSACRRRPPRSRARTRTCSRRRRTAARARPVRRRAPRRSRTPPSSGPRSGAG